jgi:hypothetical protein
MDEQRATEVEDRTATAMESVPVETARIIRTGSWRS